MKSVYPFVGWALTHVDPATKLKSASYPIPSELVGSDPWHYLYGTTRTQTTKANLNERFENYYKDHGYTRTEYDKITGNWAATDYATDCQGLLDAYLTYECGEKTDWNADYNYKYVCESKGEVSKIDRPYVIGEALFMARSNGTMHHIGWVCGFTDSNEPLVVEARSLKYGVVITKLSARTWTHRGLMTKKFDYTPPVLEPIVLTLTSPVMEGEEIKLLQKALNALHYTDLEGKALVEDGKCGIRTMAAVLSFSIAHAPAEEKAKPVEIFYGENGRFRLVLEEDKEGL